MTFVDTSAFIALTISKDTFHDSALEWWRGNGHFGVTTSNFVISETLGWVRYAAGKKIAVEIGRLLLESADITVLSVTSADEIEAWNLFKKIEGKGLSFVDCTSFVLMKRKKIKQAFAFDRDFVKAGFQIVPTHAGAS